MKKRFFCAAFALLTLAACDKSLPDGTEAVRELSVSASSDDITTKGYTETGDFYETAVSELHSDPKAMSPRTMLISSYLTPQNGDARVYFTGNTFSYSGANGIWWNTVDGEHDPVYWPIGGTLDFLAVSLSEADTHGITCKWDSTNPAEEVTMEVSADNTQNDILFASASDVKSSGAAESLNMNFNHAQAWLEFALTGSGDVPVHFKNITIEDAYNAGILTIKNNYGKAGASWDFSEQTRQNITVDNSYSVENLSAEPQYLDMLIPRQSKTSFTLCYTIGDDPTEISRSVKLDNGTWLMGERYVYHVNISSSAVNVSSTSARWK